MSKTDKQVIAEAISPDRMGLGWIPIWTTDDKGKFYEVNIGPHNILRVIEWASKQGWWEVKVQQLIGFMPICPKTEVEYQIAHLTTGKRDLAHVTQNIIKIIAEAIRREKNHASIQPARQ